MTRIVLADDHQVLRQGLKVLLEAEPGFTVVGEAGDGLEVVKLVEQLDPDVLILDLMMPSLNGLEVTRQLHRSCPRTAVVILSMDASEEHVLQVLRYGASAYVLKDDSSSELIRAVHEVLANRCYLSPPLTERAIQAYRAQAQEIPENAYEKLTTREREVLHLAADGLNNSEIAGRLSISVRTVEAHRGNLMRKLGLHNQSELIRFALKNGIISV